MVLLSGLAWVGLESRLLLLLSGAAVGLSLCASAGFSVSVAVGFDSGAVDDGSGFEEAG